MSFKLHSYKKEVLSHVQENINRALEICGGLAEGYAKTNIVRNRSVITANLKNSIAHKQIDEKTEAIGTKVYYAPFVELGTRRARPKPYLKPALEAHKDQYQNVIAAELKK